MSKVIAVIGAGYGDEGKGLMTDYFSSQYDDAVVIRSNGGAQAGHTVVTPEGQRHVFSHFGSGTFNGSPTFLSRHFVAQSYACSLKNIRRLLKNLVLSQKYT